MELHEYLEASKFFVITGSLTENYEGRRGRDNTYEEGASYDLVASTEQNANAPIKVLRIPQQPQWNLTLIHKI